VTESQFAYDAVTICYDYDALTNTDIHVHEYYVKHHNERSFLKYHAAAADAQPASNYPAETDATDTVGQYVGRRGHVGVAGREIGEKMRMMPLGYLQENW